MLISRPFWSRRQPRRVRPGRSRESELLETRELLSANPIVTVQGDLSDTDAALNTNTDGTLTSSNHQDAYSFTVSEDLGTGRLTATVLARGDLIPRLSLLGPSGQFLIQSDGGQIDQHLLPGTYSLGVSSQAGAGEYQLTTAFSPATPPLSPLPVGRLPRAVVAADFDLDGVLDLVAPSLLDSSVSIMRGNGDGTFQPAVGIVAGSSPAHVTVADVTGDGFPDILVSDPGYSTLNILRGYGDGTFAAWEYSYTGAGPSGSAVADFNGDGFADIAVSNYSDGTVSVLLGNEDATFQEEHSFEVGYGPGKVETADINGDGIPDLVTPDYGGSSVSVLIGNGDGSFEPRRVFATGSGPYSAAMVDLNGDGRPDIATSSYRESTISVLLGNSDGGFDPPDTFASGDGAYRVVAADVNGDGAPDLLTANFRGNSTSVHLGRGDGTFSRATDFTAGRSTFGLDVADLDGDDQLDIVTADFNDNAVSVLLGRGDGTFADRPTPPPVVGSRIYSLTVADLNGDGRPDVVTANKGDNNVSVLLRNEDGSFQTRQTFPAGDSPNGVVAADIDGDGVLDLVTGSYTDYSANVLKGRGDGTFESPQSFATNNVVYQLTVADVNGDGQPDILTANIDATVSVLLNYDGSSFYSQQAYGAGYGLTAITAADVDGDGLLDIVTADFNGNSLSVLSGYGDGSFAAAQAFRVGGTPGWVDAKDVNGDGIVDLVATNMQQDSGTVLLGEGGGAFQEGQDFDAGVQPGQFRLFDFDGDGVLDLVTTNIRNGDVSLLIGHGDGTFAAPVTFALGSDGTGIEIADFNQDGLADLVQGNSLDDAVTIAAGNGDGTFGEGEQTRLRKDRYSVAIADVNGDGKPDAIRSNLRQNSLTVQLGTGTGSFEPGPTLDVGYQPTSVRAADFNGDGRVDLVATNSDSDTVSVLLGNGDGTFNDQAVFYTGSSPRTVAIDDMNGDGLADLAVANYNDGSVGVLMGFGDGSFGDQEVFDVGQRPHSLAVSDINDDGYVDIVAANSADDTISVLLGNGDGSYQDAVTYSAGLQPFDIALSDVDGDGIPDAITADAFGDTLSVLTGNGDGTFQPATSFPADDQPSSVTVADLNGDGHPDLVTANFDDNTSSVLLGRGDATFAEHTSVSSHDLPVRTVTSDVNNDGLPDLVSVGHHDDSIRVLLGTGHGEFQPATAATEVALRNTPLQGDIDGDGIQDAVVLDRAGNVLFRKRLDVASNALAPPVVLNPGRPARDIAIVDTGNRLAIGAADARFDPARSTDDFVFTTSLYFVDGDGDVHQSTAFSTTGPPARLLSTDVTGDGLDDLFAANSLDNSVTVALQTSRGRFAAPVVVDVGVAPSGLAVADVNEDGLLDVLAINQASADVSVILNDAAHRFDQALRFRAGTQPYQLDAAADEPVVSALGESVSLATGDFTGDGHDDVVVVNRGAHSFTVLAGNRRGGFDNPQLELTTSTSDGFEVNSRPGAIVSGDFNTDGTLDLAVLMEDAGQAWIFTGNGDGTFQRSFTVSVGEQATGLSAIRNMMTGFLDLHVGNGFGDVLQLEGRGDGTFQIQGNRVSLSVVPDLLGPGQAGVLVGNQEDNRVTVQTQTGDGTELETIDTLGEDNAAQIAPGDVQFAQLARDTSLPDAIVVSTGGNAVIVYRTLAIEDGAPVFAPEPQTFFVGTTPTSATVADINDDGIADMLVANRGSNDVSVLFGSYDRDGAWRGVSGPRLSSGGAGPISVAVHDLTDDGVLDLAVVNGQSGDVSVLPGVGRGFFDDRSPRTLLDLGASVVEPPSFVGTSSIGFAVSGGGGLVRFDLNDAASGSRVVFSGEVSSARALLNGQVVVASVEGSVKILEADGDEFVVASVLEAQAGAPVLPSSLAVLQTAAGELQVLVSSQGSDTVSVFAPGVGFTPSVTVSVVAAPPVFLTFATVAGNLSASRFIDGLGVLESAAVRSVTAVVSLSLATFSTSANVVFSATSSAALVAVGENSYSTVAMLDFGSQQDDMSGDGRGRRPELSIRFPIGDNSPLQKFVIGLDSLIEDYRDESKASDLEETAEEPKQDPWATDLFFRQRRLDPPKQNAREGKKPEINAPAPDDEASRKSEDAENKQSSWRRGLGGQEQDAEVQASFDQFWEQNSDVEFALPSPMLSTSAAAERAAVPALLTGLLAAVKHRTKTAGKSVRRKFNGATHKYSQ